MIRSLDKQSRPLARAALEQGWQIERRGKHAALTSPSGAVVVLPVTPSDRRGWLNTRARLRREGVQC